MRRNAAGQLVTALLRTTSATPTGITTGATMLVTKDGGTPTTGAGTLTYIGSGTAYNGTAGLWKYAPTAAETNASHVSFMFGSSNTNTVMQNVQFEPTSGPILYQASLSATGGSVTNQTTIVLPSATPIPAADDDAYNNCEIVFYDSSTSGQVSVGVVLNYVGSTRTITLREAPTFTITASDYVTIIANQSLQSATKDRRLVVDSDGLGDANTVKVGPTGSGTAQTARDIGAAVPAATAGASGGLLISGSNSGTTTLGALAVTGATTLTGAVTASNASNNIVGIDVAKFSGDATAVDNAESFFDGTGYAGTNNVIPLVTTVTNLTNAATNGDLTATMKASVNTEADTALSDYGALKPTTAGRTLDVSAGGEAGIDWANVGSPSTAVDLSATTVNLVNTITTYTGNTVQTGDSFARIGLTGSGLTSLAPAATALSTAVWTGVPTGFLAATFPTTVASTTNITAGTITTVTNLTNAPTSGDLTATMKASINTEIDTALADIHLDHLLATDYDPASKPGSATALLNELIGNDAGVSQFTANALELAPSSSGTGMDADETRAALGLSSANLDAQLLAISNKTGLIPASPASTTNITAATGIVLSGVTHTGAVIPTVTSLMNAPAITSNVKKNQALASFTFLMTDSTNHAPAASKTVSVTRSIDGGAFAAGTLSSVTEVSAGVYKVDFAAADLNGNVIILRAVATGCDDTFERILTQP